MIRGWIHPGMDPWMKSFRDVVVVVVNNPYSISSYHTAKDGTMLTELTIDTTGKLVCRRGGLTAENNHNDS